jgi:hypothetical protein
MYLHLTLSSLVLHTECSSQDYFSAGDKGREAATVRYNFIGGDFFCECVMSLCILAWILERTRWNNFLKAINML